MYACMQKIPNCQSLWYGIWLVPFLNVSLIHLLIQHIVIKCSLGTRY